MTDNNRCTKGVQGRGTLSFTVGILALSPCPGRTPWWARRFKYSHIVTVGQAGYLWSQPIRGVGKTWTVEEYIKQAGEDRSYVAVGLEFSHGDLPAWVAACKAVDNRRGQRVRTVLRYLHLWPRLAWNCTSPVRILLASQGVYLKGETPDALIRELRDYPADHLAHQQVADPAD